MQSQEANSHDTTDFDRPKPPDAVANNAKRFSTDPGIPFHLLKRQRVFNCKTCSTFKSSFSLGY